MAYLNANIPPTYAQIRREYLYDFKKQISDSRTFSFLHELEMLLENGGQI